MKTICQPNYKKKSFLQNFREHHLTTESNGPCLNLLWKANASGFTPSPGPLMNPLDVQIGISSEHVIRVQDRIFIIEIMGLNQKIDELTPVKRTQAGIFSHHTQQEVHDTFHCHL
jgi:hypothetical protein